MAEIRRTAAARLDYLQIFLYVGERNLPAAERLLRQFDEKLEMISRMPNGSRSSGTGPRHS